MLNVSIIPSSSSIEVLVTYDGSDGSDAPIFVSVNEFDAHGNQMASGGPGSPIGPYQAYFSGLKPNTQYFYQLCTTFDTDAGQSPGGCGAWNEYPGKTKPALPTPSPSQQPSITITSVQAFPAMLVKAPGQSQYSYQSNFIELTWESNVPVMGVNVVITSSAGTTGLNAGGSDFPKTNGTLTPLSPPPTGVPQFGLLCTLKIRGQLGNSNNFSPFSPSVQIQDPTNPSSVRNFMFSSGIDASNGIKSMLSQSSTSNPTKFPVHFRKLIPG